jgi:hypothetical protein
MLGAGTMLVNGLRLPVLVALLAISALAGCASGFATPQEREQAMNRLRLGFVELSCRTPGCAGQWGYNFQRTVQDLRMGRTTQAAETIMVSGVETDFSWLVLGLAAERLSAPEAARLYFDRALMAGRVPNLSCARRIDQCGGVSVQFEAQQGLQRLARQQASPADVRAGIGAATPRTGSMQSSGSAPPQTGGQTSPAQATPPRQPATAPAAAPVRSEPAVPSWLVLPPARTVP